MGELTPEQLSHRQDVRRRLIALRHEGESFVTRRDEVIYEGHLAGMSYRDIARDVGVSYQTVSNVVKRMRADRSPGTT